MHALILLSAMAMGQHTITIETIIPPEHSQAPVVVSRPVYAVPRRGYVYEARPRTVRRLFGRRSVYLSAPVSCPGGICVYR